MNMQWMKRFGMLLCIVCLLGTTIAAADASEKNYTFHVDESWSDEEYALQKQAFIDRLAARTAAPMMLRASISGNTMYNEYVEVAVDSSECRFSIGTRGGDPGLASDDNQKLLFGHPSPGTSYTTVVVNGTEYIYGEEQMITMPVFSENSNKSQGRFGNVVVTQEISIVKNSATLRDDVVEIKYTAKNTGNSSASFGLRIMMDTMLGDNDHAPFRVPLVGNLTTEREFSGSSIPQYWQAFDSLNNPRVISCGNFLCGAIAPTKVQFANWGRVYDQPWNYQVKTGTANGDSAVCIIWERNLAAGQQEEYVTRYGLSELLQDLQPPLGLTIASGSSVQVDKSQKVAYQPYTITAYVQNLGNAAANNVVCRITLPDELEFAQSTDTGIISLGDIAVGETKIVEKTVQVKTVHSEEIQVEYQVTVDASNCQSKQLKKRIVIPKLENKAIIIVPGICGSRLYANEQVNTVNYLKRFEKDFMPSKPQYYTFNKNHLLWEPNTMKVDGAAAAGTTKQNKAQSEIMMLLCNEKGESRIKIKTDEPGTNVFGALDIYQTLVTSLVNTYDGQGYTVRFFSYDWRMSNKVSAQKLENYIEEQKFTDVILVCHSMGGLVASEYLNRSDDNVKKVDKLITLGTPYLGAPKALYVMETGNFLGWLQNTFCISTPLKLIANNVHGIYQLLPPKQYFNLNDTTYVQYYNNNGFWGAHYDYDASYNQTQNLLKSRSWGKTSSGNPKPMFSTAQSFYDDLFISNSKHVIEQVDYYVMIGYGKDTIMELRMEYNKDGTFKECTDLTTLNGGDGTVPIISANAGGILSESRLYYINEEHSDLAKNANVISFVKSAIDGKLSSFSNSAVKKTLPEKSSSGLLGKKIKLKIACPVTLSLVDENGDAWAYTDGNLLWNNQPDTASLYVLGENNDTKIAHLTDSGAKVLLTGTDEGTMDYTVSLFEDEKEIKRILFEDVAISKGTLIHTQAEANDNVTLQVDQDGDGDVDLVLEPSQIINGTDLEKELDEHAIVPENPVFTWDEDLDACVLTLTCTECGNFVNLQCTITAKRVDKQMCYTASAVCEGQTFSDSVYTDLPPQTGDDSHVEWYAALMLVSLAGIMVISLLRKKAMR